MLYIVIILIVLFYIFNVLSENSTLHNLTFKREISKNLVEIEEDLKINIIIENGKILPVTFLQFTEELPLELIYKQKVNLTKISKRNHHTSTMIMLPFQKVKREYEIYFNKRGKYLINNIDLFTGDFLGFKTIKQNMLQEHEVIVLPKIADLNKSIVPFGSYNGDVSVKRWILDDPTLIVSIRNYTGFEPQKNIHWPSSLKTGTLMVKQFDFTTDNSVMLILNIETCRPLWLNIQSNQIEKCISITRSIIEDFENENIPYGLITNAQLSCDANKSCIAVPGSSTKHYYELLKTLGQIPYDIECTFNTLINNIAKNNFNCGTYVIVTPVILDEDLKYINNLSNCGYKIILISLNKDNIDNVSNSILTYVERMD